MLVIIRHDKPKQEMKAAVERSIDQLFTGFNLGVITFLNQRKEWSGDTLNFSMTAHLGFVQTPIAGSALVTDTAITLDVDLGLIGKLIPPENARAQLATRLKGLLKQSES